MKEWIMPSTNYYGDISTSVIVLSRFHRSSFNRRDCLISFVVYVRYTGYPRTDPARHVQINEVKLNRKVLHQFANKHVKFGVID